ncbi:SMI1/KNR4 family protein [Tenacibaculum agarivorans]|uniref:SMI1/KNR4 family protein n=1 Tax=Tenacibaculum agarivorans TaxID=1908389 RepID=UPI00094B82C9|nr:SMI1/KNR4 family protein [Tenacibaculum agarivorans]
MKKNKFNLFITTASLVLIVGAFFMFLANKSGAQANKESISERLKLTQDARKEIDKVLKSSHSEDTTMDLIIILLDNYSRHKNLGKKLSDDEILAIEKDLNLTLPKSYKLFLKHMANGGVFYDNPINDIRKSIFLSESVEDIGPKIEIVGERKQILTNTLLPLTSVDMNGGSWCWLTNEVTENGEWPLAYYSNLDNKLHFKVTNFAEWLEILVDNRSEVISELDINEKLIFIKIT